jgi:DNA excision repair protein ERCC-2
MQVFFPYETVRGEQKKLINDISQVVIEGKTLLAHAPTGLGKTVSSLAPILSYALENKKKVFFLTPKISQHEIVLETVNLMNKKFDLGIKAVDLVGKRSLCLDPFLSHVNAGFYDGCSKKKKEKQCKYYNNVKGRTPKQRAIAQRKKASTLKEFNMKHLEMKDLCFVKELCPYEILLEQCEKADVIIADYAHVFDEMIRETIFSQAKVSLSESIVIVDEAHNLANRIRGMYSISIDVNAVERAQKEAKSLGDFETEFLLKDMGKEIVSLGKSLSLSVFESKLEDSDLIPLKKLCKHGFEGIQEASTKFMAKRKKENCFLAKVLLFIEIFLVEKKHTLHLIERKNSLGITMIPMDISLFSSDVLNNAHSAVLMSGTLVPLEMFVDILGVKNGVLKEYASPFPKENRLNLFVDKTTTKYTERNEAQFNAIAEQLNKTIPLVPGNTIVFFPSFELLERIAPRVKVSRKILKQEREMKSDDRSALINNFKSLGTGFGGILMAVSGGSIAEGVDFPGEHLSGAIIVGIPFAKLSLETRALIDFYQKKFHKGFEYAYTAPAISKAVQASGRVIRAESDRGVCVFLDKRFSEKSYEKFFPKDFVAKKTLEPEKEVSEFF